MSGTLADRLDRHRIVILLAELHRLATREREVRVELAELLEQPRSRAADAELGKLLRQLGERP